MKKLICIILSIFMFFSLTGVVFGADGPPVIIRQPQNAVYPEYGTAEYSVSAYGTNLSATWYMQFEGTVYDISQTGGAISPWEAYAGEMYGAVRDGDTFTFFFSGIGPELNGAEIWCVIEDGHYDVTSDKAIISVYGDKYPPVTVVPADMQVYRNSILDLYCSAVSVNDESLSYLWYETSTGNLPEIIAMTDESAYTDTLRCDTSEIGTRYYVCMVTEESGGYAYTSVIPVTVIDEDKPEVSQNPVSGSESQNKPEQPKPDTPSVPNSTNEPSQSTKEEKSPISSPLITTAVVAALVGAGITLLITRKRR